MEERMDNARIMLCEDDENLGMLLREYLEAKNYSVDLCVDGEEGLETFQQKKYDLCILDVMMPKMDGFTLAYKIREINSDVPFMFLTAKTLKDDVKQGFELGADDYITKPFSMEEVVFRIEAILRRVKGKKSANSSIFQIGKFTFDSKKQTLTYDNVQEKLTTKESDLLKLLASKQNELLQRDYALRAIWVDNNYYNARSMDVYITKLRKLLKDDPNVELINVHGKGYKLVVTE
ncbi:MAG: response regulator transcription factor [Bacteroidaceae bacterium]|nr:response regulator transcription factor [Bacteroidaceae bacterium]MBR6894229.1 response regulator transcription factor [Bacteroidaceae bacterium]